MKEDSAVPDSVRARLIAALALIFGEYLVLAILFDGDELAKRSGWVAGVGSIGETVTVASIVVTAGILLSRHALTNALRACAPLLGRVGSSWLLIHVLSTSCAALCIDSVFNSGRWGTIGILGFTFGGFLSSALSIIALGRALLGRGFWGLLAVLSRVVMAGLVLGSIAWMLAIESRRLWPWLARQTLTTSAWMLSLFASSVEVDLEHASLGAGGFYVEIAPECSGIEGIGLVSVFLSGYLYEFRRSLRFPRALILLPLSILLAWTANALRIAGLVAVGAWISPDVALGGFHSKAGWILFCGLALTLVYVAGRTRMLSRVAPLPTSETYNPTAAYCLPLLGVIAVSMLTALSAVSIDFSYAPRVVCAAALLWIYRSYYAEFELRPTWQAPVIGVAVFVLWLLLWPGADPKSAAELKQGIAALAPGARLTWIFFRVFGSVVITPIVEELAFRGYVQRRLIHSDFTEVSLRQVSLLSVGGSALLFGGLHQAWVAGTLAGLAYSFACYRRARLIDGMVAHATTNALIAIWVLSWDRWDLWL